MFSKKNILLISLLLVIGSSYIIFHRKKNNNDEANIVDNSDSSINNDVNEENQEASINEDTESSSSLLIVIIVIIVVIIIAAIFFFIFYRKNKENTGDILFKRYKKFKENEANKANLEEINSSNAVKNMVHYLEKTVFNALTKCNNGKKPDNFFPNNFHIHFNRNFTTDEVLIAKVLIGKAQSVIYCNFNIKKNQEFKKIFSDFFTAIVNCELYKDEHFNSKSEDEQEEIFYIFIAMIIEPFLKAAQEKTYSQLNSSYIFVNQNNKEINNDFGYFIIFIKELISDLINSGTCKKIAGFLNYIGNNGYFAFLFDRLIKEYNGLKNIIIKI